ncbi:hypothetical protein NIIDMKKI_77270 [Mycobacterium kansasii]|nr:hypothetical protein NIIDMKKI_77270 [Mycobacterium kansasii]
MFAALGLAAALLVPALRFRPLIRLAVEWLEVLAMIVFLPAAAALGGCSHGFVTEPTVLAWRGGDGRYRAGGHLDRPSCRTSHPTTIGGSGAGTSRRTAPARPTDASLQ